MLSRSVGLITKLEHGYKQTINVSRSSKIAIIVVVFIYSFNDHIEVHQCLSLRLTMTSTTDIHLLKRIRYRLFRVYVSSYSNFRLVNYFYIFNNQKKKTKIKRLFPNCLLALSHLRYVQPVASDEIIMWLPETNHFNAMISV